MNNYLPDGRRKIWDSTTLRAAQTCDRYYYYWNQGYRQLGESAHLTFGSHYAAAMEQYHKLRSTQDHANALGEVVETTLENTEGKLIASELAELPGSAKYKSRENLIRSIVWYFTHYENDPCETIELQNGKPAVELSFSFELTPDIMLCGHLDRIVSFNGDHYIQDQKTTGSALGAYYFEKFSPDTQMSLYTIAADVVWHSPVHGVMIDAAQIQQHATKFGRGFTFRTREQNNEWLHNVQQHIHHNWEQTLKNDWPMNDSACDKFGGCPFRKVCSKSPQVREDYLKVGYEKSVWDPTEVR
jgi:hypothetical protein